MGSDSDANVRPFIREIGWENFLEFQKFKTFVFAASWRAHARKIPAKMAQNACRKRIERTKAAAKTIFAGLGAKREEMRPSDTNIYYTHVL